MTTSTAPRIVIAFEAAGSAKFQVDFFNQPTEGQFQIAGEELSSIGRMLREMRLKQQLQPSIQVAPAPGMANG